MKPGKGPGILSNELNALKLRAVDRGRMRGEFEHHFFGGHAKEEIPPLTFDLNYNLWKQWYESAKVVIELENLGYTQSSETLEHFFETFFKVKLPKGTHITPEVCGHWNDKHLGFLIEIWRQQRAARR